MAEPTRTPDAASKHRLLLKLGSGLLYMAAAEALFYYTGNIIAAIGCAYLGGIMQVYTPDGFRR